VTVKRHKGRMNSLAETLGLRNRQRADRSLGAARETATTPPMATLREDLSRHKMTRAGANDPRTSTPASDAERRRAAQHAAAQLGAKTS